MPLQSPTQQKPDLYSNPDASPKIITEAASEPLLCRYNLVAAKNEISMFTWDLAS